MKFIRIPKVALRQYIMVAFKDDPELLLKYHILNGTLDQCVQDTYEKITEFCSQAECQCYIVSVDGVSVGFTVVSKENGILYSFGINKAHRTAKALTRWFVIVRYMLTCFKCYLYTKNTRAIDFLVRCGMEKKEVNDEYTILEYDATKSEEHTKLYSN